MAQFEQAAAQFKAALDRLEEIASPLADARARAADQLAENAALREERERLLARIAELEDEIRTLSIAADEVEERLDDAIGEIRTALAR